VATTGIHNKTNKSPEDSTIDCSHM